MLFIPLCANRGKTLQLSDYHPPWSYQSGLSRTPKATSKCRATYWRPQSTLDLELGEHNHRSAHPLSVEPSALSRVTNASTSPPPKLGWSGLAVGKLNEPVNPVTRTSPVLLAPRLASSSSLRMVWAYVSGLDLSGLVAKIKAVAGGAGASEARKLDAAFRAKLHLLHQELGVPELVLNATACCGTTLASCCDSCPSSSPRTTSTQVGMTAPATGEGWPATAPTSVGHASAPPGSCKRR